MEQILSGLHWKTLLIYLDDVIVISPDFITHISCLPEVFDRLRAAGLKFKPSKCALLQQEVTYLGHVVGRDGVAIAPEKVLAVKGWAVPLDLSELQAFLGLVWYYKQYVPGFAGVAQPLNRLTAKRVDTGGSASIRPPQWRRQFWCILIQPNNTSWTPNTSDHSVGAVLSQG